MAVTEKRLGRNGPSFVEIHLVDATITTQPLRGREVTVVYGKVMPNYFGEQFITVPDFQRMPMLSGGKHQGLVDAFAPDGMGVPNDPEILVGEDHEVVTLGAGGVLIRASVFNLADGHQRFVAARGRLDRGQSTHPMLVKFILGLTPAEQLSVFHQINREQTPVSTHVHLRNIHNISAAVELRRLATERGFPQLKLDQQQHGGEEITVRMWYEVVALLHGYRPSTPEDILNALEDLTKRVGVPQIIENTKVFFKTLKACFNGNVYDKNGKDLGLHPLSKYVYRRDLMGGLAVLFAQHRDFWDKRKPTKLFISKGNINKLRGVTPRSAERALGTASARRAVYEELRYHINGGREKYPLTPWTPPWRGVEPSITTLVDDMDETDGKA